MIEPDGLALPLDEPGRRVEQLQDMARFVQLLDQFMPGRQMDDSRSMRADPIWAEHEAKRDERLGIEHAEAEQNRAAARAEELAHTYEP